jgi:hypothetical protein
MPTNAFAPDSLRSWARVSEGPDWLSLIDTKGRTMSIELPDTRFAIHSAAARLHDRCPGASPSLMGGAKRVSDKLIEASHAREVNAKLEAPVLRRDVETRNVVALKLTAGELKAVDACMEVEDDQKDAPSNACKHAAAILLLRELRRFNRAATPVAIDSRLRCNPRRSADPVPNLEGNR